MPIRSIRNTVRTRKMCFLFARGASLPGHNRSSTSGRNLEHGFSSDQQSATSTYTNEDDSLRFRGRLAGRKENALGRCFKSLSQRSPPRQAVRTWMMLMYTFAGLSPRTRTCQSLLEAAGSEDYRIIGECVDANAWETITEAHPAWQLKKWSAYLSTLKGEKGNALILIGGERHFCPSISQEGNYRHTPRRLPCHSKNDQEGQPVLLLARPQQRV